MADLKATPSFDGKIKHSTPVEFVPSYLNAGEATISLAELPLEERALIFRDMGEGPPLHTPNNGIERKRNYRAMVAIWDVDFLRRPGYYSTGDIPYYIKAALE